MAHFYVDASAKNMLSITLKIHVNASDSGEYKVVISRSGAADREVSFGTISKNVDLEKTITISDLKANTNYTFNCQLLARNRWDGDAAWFYGLKTSYTTATAPKIPYSPSVSLNSGQTSITVNWQQNSEGSARTIYTAVVVRNTSVSTTVSNATSCTLDVSGLSNGTYYVDLTANNNISTDTATYLSKASTSPTFTINRSAQQPSGQTVSGSITSSEGVPSGTTADINFTFYNSSESAFAMYYIVGVGLSNASSASSYTYKYTSGSLTAQTGSRSYSIEMPPDAGDELETGKTYYYRIEVYGKGSGENSYSAVASDTGSFSTNNVQTTGGDLTITDKWDSMGSVDSLHTLYVTVRFNCSSTASRYYNPALYYSTSPGVTIHSSSPISGGAKLLNSSSGEQTWERKITGLDSNTKYYVKAIMLTGTSASTANGVTDIESTEHQWLTSINCGSWTTQPSVEQISGGNTCKISGTYTAYVKMDRTYLSKILVYSSSSLSDDSLVCSSSAVSVEQFDTFNISWTTSALPGGTYTYYFVPMYYDEELYAYNPETDEWEGTWDYYKRLHLFESDNGVDDIKSVTFAVSGAVVTGYWSVEPIVTQSSGVNAVSYNATFTRNDSVSDSYYVVIRVVDSNTGAIVARSDELYIPTGGSVSISGTKSSMTANKQYSYTFIPEYSSYSGGWSRVSGANGEDMARSVGFSISDSTVSGAPTGYWSTNPVVSQTPGAMTVDYSSAITRNDADTNSYYIRVRVSSGSTSIHSDSGSYISNTGTVTTSGRITTSLSANTYTYTFTPEWKSLSSNWAPLTDANGNSLVTTVQFAVTNQSSSSLKTWSWVVGNVDTALASKTIDAYTAVTNHGFSTDFSYLVWNDLCNFVNQTLSSNKVGLSWYGMSLSNTKMTSSDKVLTASRFNALVMNVNLIISKAGTSKYTPTSVNSKDPVRGSYFTGLTTKLNNAIIALNG